MPQSNINLMYESIVADLAERAKMIMDEQPELDKTDAIWQAEDEGLIYTSDQAYIIAHAFCNGFTTDERTGWGCQLDWEAIGENLYADIADELDRLRGED